jgi:hypothetical protein
MGRSRPTEWLSGSGGAGETPYQLLHILAKRACAERQSRCPTGAGVSPLFLFWKLTAELILAVKFE